MTQMSYIPDYIFPGQAFQEMASIAYVMPKYPALAYAVANLPGSRAAVSSAAQAIMIADKDPYTGE